MKLDNAKTTETSLVLTTLLIVVFIITCNIWFLYLALAFAVTGIFIKQLSKYIAIGWFKLAEILNLIISKIILGLLFFIVLFPVAVLYKITGNDNLRFKKSVNSGWIERNHIYVANDLTNTW